MGTLVIREEATVAVMAVFHAGLTELRLGHGENIGSDHTDNDGRVLEWVTIGTDLWKRFAPGIPGPWEHTHEETDEMLWDVLDQVDRELLPIGGPIRKSEGDGYAEDICLERVLPEPVAMISLHPLYADRLAAAAAEVVTRECLAKREPTYDREQFDCCGRITAKRRAAHARSATHVAALYGVEADDLRREVRYLGLKAMVGIGLIAPPEGA